MPGTIVMDYSFVENSQCYMHILNKIYTRYLCLGLIYMGNDFFYQQLSFSCTVLSVVQGKELIFFALPCAGRLSYFGRKTVVGRITHTPVQHRELLNKTTHPYTIDKLSGRSDIIIFSHNKTRRVLFKYPRRKLSQHFRDLITA